MMVKVTAPENEDSEKATEILTKAVDELAYTGVHVPSFILSFSAFLAVSEEFSKEAFLSIAAQAYDTHQKKRNAH